MGNKPRMESKGNNNNSNDSMEAQNRNGLMCCSVPAARGCCFGVISLRTGVRHVAASLLLVSVLSLVETTVLIGEEHHGEHDIEARHPSFRGMHNVTAAGHKKGHRHPHPGRAAQRARTHDDHDDHDDHEDHEDHEDDHETMLEVFGVITIMIGVCGCIQGCRATRSQEKRTAELFCWAIAFLLVLRVLQMVATAVWILANEHARQHLMGYICAELALVMCYVYGLYIALSYVKALWQDSTTMNGAVVALESVTVHTCQVSAEQNNVVHVMATPVQGHIAQGSPSKIPNSKKHGPSPWAAGVKPARLVGAMWK